MWIRFMKENLKNDILSFFKVRMYDKFIGHGGCKLKIHNFMISLKLEIYLYDRITPTHVIPQNDFMTIFKKNIFNLTPSLIQY